MFYMFIKLWLPAVILLAVIVLTITEWSKPKKK
jgi:hypothetical protein